MRKDALQLAGLVLAAMLIYFVQHHLRASVASSEESGPVVIQAPLENPKLIIRKFRRVAELYDGDTLVKSYAIAIGRQDRGDKQREGDMRTPEGRYYICTRNPQSRFHLFLGISYPGPDDAGRALMDGMITFREYQAVVEAYNEKKCPPWNLPLGGQVGIHGGGRYKDWTEGCIALSNDDIEELWGVLKMGDPVEILK